MSTEVLYIPEPVIQGYRDLIESQVPADIRVSVAQQSLPSRAVNLWPGTPQVESLALAGAMRSRLTFQATCVGTSVTDARTIGDRVRMTIVGRTARYALLHRHVAEGTVIIDAEASEGRSDNSGGIPQWTEMFTIVYDTHTPPPAP